MVALLEEMGHKFFIPAVRTLAVVVRNALRRITKGIYINTSGIEKVVCGCGCVGVWVCGCVWVWVWVCV